MARVGQVATHWPQPVQSSTDTMGWAIPPSPGRKRIAPRSHISPHTRHSTLRSARQSAATVACHDHATRSGEGRRAFGEHVSAQRPQNVHPAVSNETTGNPPSPRRRMPSGQAAMQASQRVHTRTNPSSGPAQGGRGGANWAVEGGVTPPLRKKRRPASMDWEEVRPIVTRTGCPTTRAQPHLPSSSMADGSSMVLLEDGRYPSETSPPVNRHPRLDLG
jgi:hypothetical protein